VFNSGDVSGGDEYRQQFNRTDPWDGVIESYLSGKAEYVGRLADLYRDTLGLGDPECMARLTRRETDRVGAILRRLGFTRRGGGYVWKRDKVTPNR